MVEVMSKISGQARDLVMDGLQTLENQNEKTGRVIAVLNMDSSEKNQFVSSKFIREKIFPAINPFLTILQVLYNNNKVQS